jgi:hypothetical protein
MGTIDWFGSVIVGDHIHRPRRMQSWLSHFAMVLEFRRDGDAPRDLWVLERGDQGINYFPFFPDEFDWNRFRRCDGQVPVSGSFPMLSSIPRDDNFVVNNGITRQAIWDFVSAQNELPYNIVGKNCKHFVYDFQRYCIHHHWVQHGNEGEHFPVFSEMLEKGWI